MKRLVGLNAMAWLISGTNWNTGIGTYLGEYSSCIPCFSESTALKNELSSWVESWGRFSCLVKSDRLFFLVQGSLSLPESR
jgi:hypothetical protein